MTLLPTLSCTGSSTTPGLQSLPVFQIRMPHPVYHLCCLLFAKGHHRAICMSSFSSSFPVLPFKASLATQTLGCLYFLPISWAPGISITYLAFSVLRHYDNSSVFYFLCFYPPTAKYKPFERSNFSVLVARFQAPRIIVNSLEILNTFLLNEWINKWT